MEIVDSARKHGVTDDDIAHSWDNAIRLVAVPAYKPTRIIHADRLRPKLFDYLR